MQHSTARCNQPKSFYSNLPKKPAFKISSNSIVIDKRGMLEREESTTVSVSSEITTANTASVVLSLKSAEFSNSQDEKPPGPADPSVAGTEQKNVHRARLVVVAVLLLALAVVSTTVHQLIRTGEKGDFESEVRTARLRVSRETCLVSSRPVASCGACVLFGCPL